MRLKGVVVRKYQLKGIVVRKYSELPVLCPLRLKGPNVLVVLQYLYHISVALKRYSQVRIPSMLFGMMKFTLFPIYISYKKMNIWFYSEYPP